MSEELEVLVHEARKLIAAGTERLVAAGYNVETASKWQVASPVDGLRALAAFTATCLAAFESERRAALELQGLLAAANDKMLAALQHIETLEEGGEESALSSHSALRIEALEPEPTLSESAGRGRGMGRTHPLGRGCQCAVDASTQTRELSDAATRIQRMARGMQARRRAGGLKAARLEFIRQVRGHAVRMTLLAAQELAEVECLLHAAEHGQPPLHSPAPGVDSTFRPAAGAEDAGVPLDGLWERRRGGGSGTHRPSVATSADSPPCHRPPAPPPPRDGMGRPVAAGPGCRTDTHAHVHEPVGCWRGVRGRIVALVEGGNGGRFRRSEQRAGEVGWGGGHSFLSRERLLMHHPQTRCRPVSGGGDDRAGSAGRSGRLAGAAVVGGIGADTCRNRVEGGREGGRGWGGGVEGADPMSLLEEEPCDTQKRLNPKLNPRGVDTTSLLAEAKQLHVDICMRLVELWRALQARSRAEVSINTREIVY